MEVMEYHYVYYKAPGKTSAGQAVIRLALMGRAVSEDCQPASAALLHSVNPLPSITRCRSN